MKQRGFSLVELGVAAFILAVLVVVVLDRMHYYQEAAEKTAMEQTVSDLRGALRLSVAERQIQGGPGLADLVQSNPMDWLSPTPKNYIGVRHGAKVGEVAGGNWYFDLQDRELVYVVNLGEHFAPDRLGRKQVRFALRPLKNKTQERSGTAENEIQGIVLSEVAPYRWF